MTKDALGAAALVEIVVNEGEAGGYRESAPSRGKTSATM